MTFALPQPSTPNRASGAAWSAARGRKGVIARGQGVIRRVGGRVLDCRRGTPPPGGILMTSLVPALCALVLSAGAAAAQTPRLAEYSGSTWGYFLYETGGDLESVLSGQPRLHWGHPDAVITLVSRDGHAVRAQDRAEGARLARALCERQGRFFNTASQGAFLSNGGLSFAGDCTR